jgi:hypothetical protein
MTVQIVLKPESGPQVNIAHGGDYYQEFHRALEPFVVSVDEWMHILERTGLFHPAEPSS